MPKAQSKDHDLLIRVEQKLDDLGAKLGDHIAKEDPVINTVPQLSESVRWVTRMVVGAYATVATAAVGAVAAYLAK